MNIPMASVLRRYRRERNITKETLVDALGVTFQSVSRRENGLAYPDVELIPKIAGYFGISADVLFGTDKDTLEAKRQAHIHEIEKYDVTYVWNGDTEEARRDGDKFIAANYAMLEEFPDDCDAMFRLLQFYTIARKDELPAHTEELKRYC